jgi:hypothetical protein
VDGFFPKDWDSVGNPPGDFTMPFDGVLVYEPTGHFYMFVQQQFNTGAWIDIGAAQGQQGQIGVQGPIGPIGPAGPQGAAGPAGTQGAQGVQGQQGPQGIIGLGGPQGSQGPQGSMGPQGTIGATGQQGPQGVPGPPGPNVNIIGSFTNHTPAELPPDGFIPAAWDAPNSPPADVQLIAGEGLIYTADNVFWMYAGTTLVTTGWIALGAIEGPAGVEGPPGIDGPQGPVGPQGIQGSQGPVGLQGSPGPAGAPGVAGPQGPQGPSGEIGPSGPQGAVGNPALLAFNFGPNQTPADLPDNGIIPIDWENTNNPPAQVNCEIGYIGFDNVGGHFWVFQGSTANPIWVDGGQGQGPQGIQGPIGQTGPVGPQGIQGPVGPVGPVGPQGIQGPIGNTGPQGPIGNTGPVSFPDALSDGTTYGRNNAGWVNVVVPSDLSAAVANYVPLAGGTMTGPLILSANPTVNLGAVTKQYVDTLTNSSIDPGTY